jgi:hypothetical protein
MNFETFFDIKSADFMNTHHIASSTKKHHKDFKSAMSILYDCQYKIKRK